ncbi:hypothetical protein QQG55_5880 [Brugia pahangi]|uniref:Secreted protein n=1 Tax=Brugia pahangi TaxID=6280 RepID=A0A0N4TQ62_BRUPA|nr:unnamed protein product [Brugia pahangi]
MSLLGVTLLLSVPPAGESISTAEDTPLCKYPISSRKLAKESTGQLFSPFIAVIYAWQSQKKSIPGHFDQTQKRHSK